MRGISPVVAFVLVLAIALMATLALYYWVLGSTGEPASEVYSNSDIQVHAYNSTRLLITNIGVVNTTRLVRMSTSHGNCVFDAPAVLIPGVTYACSLATPASGEVRVWASGVNAATIYL